MRRGLYISGIGHGALILWLLFGGLFMRENREPMVPVTDVSILSEEEFAALTAPAEAPPAPEVSPTPPPRPTPEPEPIPEPPAPDPGQPDEPEVTDTPTPPEEDRVADEVIEAPEEPAEVAPEPVEDTTPSEESTETPEVEQDAAQPEAQTTEIVTEAEQPSSAPTASIRPRSRPTPPVVAEQEVTPEPDPEPTPETPAETPADPLADAIADALGDNGSAETTAPLGPPLTSAERDGLRVAVSQCWNLGSASTDAMQTVVVVLVQMGPDARPQGIELVSSTGTNQNATQTAFQAARRAIIRCGANGYNLPSEKYEQWREIEMTFNPANMRLR